MNQMTATPFIELTFLHNTGPITVGDPKARNPYPGLNVHQLYRVFLIKGPRISKHEAS